MRVQAGSSPASTELRNSASAVRSSGSKASHNCSRVHGIRTSAWKMRLSPSDQVVFPESRSQCPHPIDARNCASMVSSSAWVCTGRHVARTCSPHRAAEYSSGARWIRPSRCSV
ncbi:hypothetical protein AB0O51_23185 [Streptomyces sp. NPDC090301]|uniref:hypothetical protein n=1 Tax=Streptomyces sp. NPDC090301 TaxID=3154975 RepID=UPI0034146ABC